MRFELTTATLARWSSTTELRSPIYDADYTNGLRVCQHPDNWKVSCAVKVH